MSHQLDISPTEFTEFIEEYEEGDYFTIPSRGISFVENIREKIKYVEVGDPIVFDLVDDNKYDDYAVRMSSISQTPKGKRKIDIGWMPTEINKNYRDELDRGTAFYAEVSWVSPGEFDDNDNPKRSPGVRIDIFDFDEGQGVAPDIVDDFFASQDEEPPF